MKPKDQTYIFAFEEELSHGGRAEAREALDARRMDQLTPALREH